MKLWLLRPIKDLSEDDDPWDPWFDKSFGFVVRAKDQTRARTLASAAGGDEVRSNKYPWLYSKYSTCEELRIEGPEGIILRDYRAA